MSLPRRVGAESREGRAAVTRGNRQASGPDGALVGEVISLCRQVAILEAAMVDLEAPAILVTLAEEIHQSAAELALRLGGGQPAPAASPRGGPASSLGRRRGG